MRITIKTIFTFLLILFSSNAFGATYYVDTDASGTDAGTDSNPFTAMDSGAWSTINSSLAGEDVTVYFSAREAGSDVDQLYDVADDGTQDQITLTSKTADPGFLLTLNGSDFYNTNDGSPSWGAYSGSSRSKINSAIMQNGSHVKYNDITVDGFNIASTTTKAVSVCGDDFTLQNCDVTHTAAASDGPLVLLVPTADGAHEGSSSYCGVMDNLTFDNNIFHDSYGELLYLGGGGSGEGGPSDPPPGTGTWADCGYPSHTNITVTDNTFYNGGIRGAQGDGIDMKGGLKNVTISGNTIYNMSDPETRAMIVSGWQDDEGATDQNIVIEKNYIHDCTNWYEAISFSNTWGGTQGCEIRNNIFDTNAAEGIRIYTDSDGSQYFPAKWITIYNNTFYNQTNYAIQGDSTSQTTFGVKNNAMVDNNSGGAQVTWSGTVTQSNNAYSDTFGETCTSCQTITNADFTDAAGGDFTLVLGSDCIDNGTDLSGSFTDDFIDTVRPQNSVFDISAYEFVDSGGGTSGIIYNQNGIEGVFDQANGVNVVAQ